MKKISTFILTTFALLPIFFSTGCATIFGHSSYMVTINSTPPLSNISVTDKKGVEVYNGTAPATIKLKSSAGYFSRGQYHVKYHLAGYEDKTVTIDAKLNGWYIGNILIGGLVGMLIVDPASGAMYEIADKNINEALQKSVSAQLSTLEIIDISSLSGPLRKKLVKIN